MEDTECSGHPPNAEPALRAIAMPADANPHGDIFGGWLLSQMDLAGGTAATRRAKGRTVTVAVTAMTFHRPVFIGDEVTCYATIIKVGRTSITVKSRELGSPRHRRRADRGDRRYFQLRGGRRRPQAVPGAARRLSVTHPRRHGRACPGHPRLCSRKRRGCPAQGRA